MALNANTMSLLIILSAILLTGFTVSRKHKIRRLNFSSADLHAVRWTLKDVSNIGKILNKIDCPNTLIISHNTWYSHEDELTYSSKIVFVIRYFLPNLPPENLLLGSGYAKQYGNVEWSNQNHSLYIKTNLTLWTTRFASMESKKMRCLFTISINQNLKMHGTFANRSFWHFPWDLSYRTLTKISEHAGFYVLPLIFIETTKKLYLLSEYLETPDYRSYLTGFFKLSSPYTKIEIGMIHCVYKSSQFNHAIPNVRFCQDVYLCRHCAPASKFVLLRSGQLLTHSGLQTIFNNLAGFTKWYCLDFSQKYTEGDHENLFKVPVNFNPFLTARAETDFAIVIFKMLYSFLGNNQTIKFEISDSNFVKLAFNIPMNFNHLHRFRKNRFLHADYVFVADGGFDYITCYSTKRIAFGFYFQPFQMKLWTVTIGSLLLLVFFANWYLSSFKNSARHRFSIALYMWQVLLENGPVVPAKLLKRTACKIFLSTWLYLAIHLTNSYRGIITGSTTAAIPETTDLRSFHDIKCNVFSGRNCAKIYGNLRRNLQTKWDLLPVPSTAKHVNTFYHTSRIPKTEELWTGLCKTEICSIADEILSRQKSFKKRELAPSLGVGFAVLVEGIMSGRPLIDISESVYSWLGDREFINKLLKPAYKPSWESSVLEYFVSNIAQFWVPGRFSDGVGRHAFRSAVETEIVNCQNKSVLLLDYHKARSEFAYLSKHFPTKTFFISNKTLLKTSMAWKFVTLNGKDNRLLNYFVVLIQSGIYKVLSDFHLQGMYSMSRFQHTRNNSDYGRFVRPLGLNSNIGSVFYLCGVMLVIAMLAFVLQNLIFFRRYLKLKLTCVFIRIKELFKLSQSVALRWLVRVSVRCRIPRMVAYR